MTQHAASDGNDPTRRLERTAKLAKLASKLTVKLDLETKKQRESSERVFKKSEGVNRMREKK